MDEQQLQEFFQALDQDGDSKVSLQDLRDSLSNLGIGLDPQMLMNKLDKTGKGYFSFEEFRRGHSVLLGGDDDGASSENEGSDESFGDDMGDGGAGGLIDDICSLLRVGADGRVSLVELERGLSVYFGRVLNDEERENMMNSFGDDIDEIKEGVSLTRISEALTQWMKNETGDDPPGDTAEAHDDYAAQHEEEAADEGDQIDHTPRYSGIYSPAGNGNWSQKREAAIKQHVNMCIKENENLTEQLNDMRRRFDEQTNEISKLRATVMMTKRSEERVKKELAQSTEREMTLKSKLEQANRAHSDARIRITELQKQRDQMRHDIGSATTTINQMTPSPRTMAIKASKGRLVSVEQHEKLKAKLRETAQQAELLVSKVSEKTTLIKRLTAAVAHKNKLYVDQKSQLQALKQSMQRTKEAAAKPRVDSIDLTPNDAYDELEEENPFEEFQEEDGSLMDELNEPAADLVKVHEAEMAEAVTKAQEKQKHELEQHFNQRLSTAMATADTKQKDMSAQHQQELAAVKKQLSDAKANADTKQQGMSAQHQQELAAVQKQLSDAMATADAKQKDMSAQHQQELAAVKKQLSDAVATADAKQEDMSAQHQQELAAVKKQLSDAKANADTKQHDMSAQHQKELAAIQQKLDQLHREREQLEQQVEQLETQKTQTLNQHREHLDREQTRLQRIRQQHQVAIDSLTKQLESAMNDTTAKAKEVAELQTKLIEAQQNQKPTIDPDVVSDPAESEITAAVSELEARVSQLQQDNERLIKVQEGSEQELQALRAQNIKYLAAITAADEVRIELDQSQAALQQCREQAKLQENQHAAAVALLKEQQQTVANSLQGEISDLQDKVKVQEKQHATAVAVLKEQHETTANSLQAVVADSKMQAKLQEKQHAATVALLKEQQQTEAKSLQDQVTSLEHNVELQKQKHVELVVLLKQQQKTAQDSLHAEVEALKEQVEVAQAEADDQRKAAIEAQNRYDTLSMNMKDLRAQSDGSKQHALDVQSRLKSEIAALASHERAIDAGEPGIGAGPQPDTPAPPTESTSTSNGTSLVTALGEITNISDQDYDGALSVAKGVERLLESSQKLRGDLERKNAEVYSQATSLAQAQKQMAKLRKALARAQSSMALMPTVIRPWRDNDVVDVPMPSATSDMFTDSDSISARHTPSHRNLSGSKVPPPPPPGSPGTPPQRAKALRHLLHLNEEVGTENDSSPVTPSSVKSPIVRSATPNTRGMYENVLRRMATNEKNFNLTSSNSGRMSPAVRGEKRRRSMSRTSAMPASHGPRAPRGLEKFIATKKRAVTRRKAKIASITSPSRSGLFRQHAQLELNQLEGFTALAMSQINTFMGDYREFKKRVDKVLPLLASSGGKINEEIVFSSVVTRCLPRGFMGILPAKRKRTLLITTGAVYELTQKGDRVLARTDYFALNCLSLATNASDAFALIAPQSFDFLYQSMRRTEIATRIMQCYEAFTGTYLKVRFMKSILLTMESGEVKNTYVDEKSASVKMETYQPKQISGSAQGFICPECHAKFSTAKKLQKHHTEVHAGSAATQRTQSSPQRMNTDIRRI